MPPGNVPERVKVLLLLWPASLCVMKPHEAVSIAPINSNAQAAMRHRERSNAAARSLPRNGLQFSLDITSPRLLKLGGPVARVLSVETIGLREKRKGAERAG